MLGFSPGTGGKPLTARPIILPRFADSTEFVRWLPRARGRLILVSAPQPTCRATEDWTAQATPASKERMDSLRAQLRREWANPDVRGTGYSLALGTGELGLRLEAAGVAGIITSRPKDALGDDRDLRHLRQDALPPLRSPARTTAWCIVSPSTIRGRCSGSTSMRSGSRERPIFNTIATIPGEIANEYVMLSAHFDSWDGSSGATDNGTGTIMMMEAMRILKEAYPRPHRTILVGHWTSEENGLVGSRAFSEDHPEVLEGMMVLMNQDNGTGRVVRMAAGGLPNAARHVEEWLGKTPDRAPPADHLRGRRLPVGRRQRRCLVCVPRAAGVQSGRAGLELRQLYLAHQPRHLRQDRLRRPARRTRPSPRCWPTSPPRTRPGSLWVGWIWRRSRCRPKRQGRARRPIPPGLAGMRHRTSDDQAATQVGTGASCY